MKITIDTKEDHPDEIRRIISFLQNHLDGKGEQIHSNSPAFTNIFAEESSNSAPQEGSSQENSGFVNIFADDFGQKESSQETPDAAQGNTDVLGNFFGEGAPDSTQTTEENTEEKKEEKPKFSLFDLETY